MGANSQAKKELQRIFGDGCFMERAGIRTVKGFKKTAHSITYHHLKHRSEGGETTVDNGANLAKENHEFLHSLSRAKEEIINNRIRRWKANFLAIQNGEVVDAASLELENFENEDSYITIDLQDVDKKKQKRLKREQKRKMKDFSGVQMDRKTRKALMRAQLLEEDNYDYR